MEEMWLPAAEVAEASGGNATPSKLAPSRRVRFGSSPHRRTSSSTSSESGKASDDGESRSDDSEVAIYWNSAPRSGVFTVDEQDLPRVTPDAVKRHARCNIFLSKNFWTCERLLVIIQGSGAVRPGQWSRSLCITHSIHAGAVFDYLQVAKETNMGVIILNPNHNQIKVRVRAIDQPVSTMNAQHAYNIKGHDTHIAHVLSIYDQFIGQCKAKELYFVAHGRGGDTLLQLLNKRLDIGSSSIPSSPTSFAALSAQDEAQKRPISGTFSNRIRAIAFVNSAHSVSYANSDRVKQLIEERSVHWVLSALPLDSSIPEQADNFGCTCVSSGHLKADFAPACSVNSVFEFFSGRVAPNESKPSWAPITIPFSNPPQNMPFHEESNGDYETNSEPDTAELRREKRLSGESFASSSDHSSASTRLIDPPLPLHFGNSAPHQNGPSNHERRTSNEHQTSSSLKRQRVTPSEHSRSQCASHEDFLVEMIEMGTQTDPRPSIISHEASPSTPTPTTPLLSSPSSARPFVQSYHTRLEALSRCPLCRVFGWISESGVRSLISVVLLAAGVYTTRLFLQKRMIGTSSYHQ